MDEIQQLILGTDLNIHVIVPGKEQDIQKMKEEIGITLEINNDPNLSLHKDLKLSLKKDGKMYALRGYAIVKAGKRVESHEMVEIGERSVQLVQEALKK